MANNTERLYKIELLIRTRGLVSFAAMLEALDVSPATLKRDIEYLRSRLGAPIEYDRFLNGYRFAGEPEGQQARASPATANPSNAHSSSKRPVGNRHELPGLWFDESELYSLLMAHQLLAGLDEDGLLARHLAPLLERIHHLLGSQGQGGKANAGRPAQDWTQRVRVVSALKRPVPSRHFQRVSQALFHRKRLQLRYLTRGRGQVSEREVSPQRLVHYRSTWYLDAYCHRAEGLRRFALDAIEHAQAVDTSAKPMPLQEVAQAMDAGYGIYAGGRKQWATLRFDAVAAQWASKEVWHVEQEGRPMPDGSFELRLPYVEETELVMDILRQGEQVQVLAPTSLRQTVHRKLAAALQAYEGPSPVQLKSSNGVSAKSSASRRSRASSESG